MSTTVPTVPTAATTSYLEADARMRKVQNEYAAYPLSMRRSRRFAEVNRRLAEACAAVDAAKAACFAEGSIRTDLVGSHLI
jgi:hypothetical protein